MSHGVLWVTSRPSACPRTTRTVAPTIQLAPDSSTTIAESVNEFVVPDGVDEPAAVGSWALPWEQPTSVKTVRIESASLISSSLRFLLSSSVPLQVRHSQLNSTERPQ